MKNNKLRVILQIIASALISLVLLSLFLIMFAFSFVLFFKFILPLSVFVILFYGIYKIISHNSRNKKQIDFEMLPFLFLHVTMNTTKTFKEVTCYENIY